jgi:ribonuclease HII
VPRKASSRGSWPSARFEDEAIQRGATRIAGVDEAGRGPLAGPVVAAAVVLAAGRPIPGLNDSKLLTPAKRERLFHEIQGKAEAVGIAAVPVETINRINILQATRLAMTNAIAQILPPPDYLLVDGPILLDLAIPQRAIIDGDKLSFSVAAGGIMAKVTRDRIMAELHERFPRYGFDRNKGYGTREHREAIARHGPTPAHRTHFRGVKEHLLGGLFFDR